MRPAAQVYDRFGFSRSEAGCTGITCRVVDEGRSLGLCGSAFSVWSFRSPVWSRLAT